MLEVVTLLQEPLRSLGEQEKMFIPNFQLIVKMLYFLRPNPEQPIQSGTTIRLYKELVGYNIETGELTYIISYYPQEETGVLAFSVNQNTGQVAFITRTNVANSGFDFE